MPAEVRPQRHQLKWIFLGKTPEPVFTTICHTLHLFFCLTKQKIITVICTDVLLVPLPLSPVSGPSLTAQTLNLGALQGAVHLSQDTPAPTLPSLPAAASPVLCLQAALAGRCSL